MSSPRPLRMKILAGVCILVCTVASALGWFAGMLSSYLYGQDLISHDFIFAIPRNVAGRFGLCTGLIASILWCRIVIPLTLQNVAGLRSMSGLVGLCMGALQAVMLHGIMMFTEGQLRPTSLAVGMGMAAPAGLLLGVIGGQLCRFAMTTHRAYRATPSGRRVVQFTGPVPGPDFMEQLDVRSSMHPRQDFRDEYDA